MTCDDLCTAIHAAKLLAARDSQAQRARERETERETEREEDGENAPCTYRVINTPHKHAEQWLVRTEELNLLVLNPKVLLFQLAEPAGHLRHARHADARLPRLRHLVACRE